MLKAKSVVLLITGCMAPDNNVHMLALSDSNERRVQYLRSIKFYIEKTKAKKIVYCDNSNAMPDREIIALADRYGKQFEWLHFTGDVDKAIKQGKGYGEAEIVEYALEHSQLISQVDCFVKVTGRLFVKNIDLLLMLCNKQVYFWPTRVRDARFYINTRIYIMPVQVYKQFFLQTGDLVNDTERVYLEHAFGICVKKYDVKYHKFLLAPWIEGLSGSTGREYKPTIISYIKDCLRLWRYSH